MRHIITCAMLLTGTVSAAGTDIRALEMAFHVDLSPSELHDLLTLCGQVGISKPVRIEHVLHNLPGPRSNFVRIYNKPVRRKGDVFECTSVDAYNDTWGGPKSIVKPSRKGNWVTDLSQKRVIELTALPVSPGRNITLYTTGLSGLSADVATRHLRSLLSGQFTVQGSSRSFSAETVGLFLSACPITRLKWLNRIAMEKDVLTIDYSTDCSIQVRITLRVKGDTLTMVNLSAVCE